MEDLSLEPLYRVTDRRFGFDSSKELDFALGSAAITWSGMSESERSVILSRTAAALHPHKGGYRPSHSLLV